MTQYTPSQDDIKKAKEIFDKIIMTQTLNPIKIKEAYKLLFGLDATNTQLARMKVHAYFTYTFKGFDKTETAIPEESTSLSTETSTPQSHSEDDEAIEGIVIPEGSFEKECHSDAFAKVIDGKIVYDNTLPKNGESETQPVKNKRGRKAKKVEDGNE